MLAKNPWVYLQLCRKQAFPCAVLDFQRLPPGTFPTTCTDCALASAARDIPHCAGSMKKSSLVPPNMWIKPAQPWIKMIQNQNWLVVQ